jgi:micrococcal nuclease
MIEKQLSRKKQIVIAIICISFSFSAFAAGPVCREQGIVTWIVDGDTIIVKLQNKSEKIRLLGIDTPEFHGKNNIREYFAYEAFIYTKEHLKDKPVCLVKDPQNDRDKYGRLLRYVYINGRSFNAELVRDGYAEIYYKGDHSMKTFFLLLQDEAKHAQRGMWKVRKQLE